jgi:hypothetical protein
MIGALTMFAARLEQQNHRIQKRSKQSMAFPSGLTALVEQWRGALRTGRAA